VSFLYGDDGPIIACSTGNNAVASLAVIRISGFSDLSELSPCLDRDLNKVKPRQVYRSNIVNSGEHLDDALITYFKAPNSFTGENVLEISCHGNGLNVERIIEAFGKSCNIRVALRGEFSYRAYRNKKLSLAQVEGLDLFLHANSSYALNQGLALLHGELHRSFLDLREKFINLRSSMELAIDFSDDVGDDVIEKLIGDNFTTYFTALKKLKERSTISHKSLLSPEIVFFGKTNAGKSTLFNALFGEDRSIISDEEGTTRDYISEYINLGGNTFKLVDTAGVRDAQNQIERKGIDRAFAIAENAFYRVLVIDPKNWSPEDKKTFDKFDYDLIFFTHFDEENSSISLGKITNSLPNFKSVFLSGSIGPRENNSGPIEPEICYFGPIGPSEIEKTGSIGPAVNCGPIEPPKKKISGPIGPKEWGSKELVFEEILNKFNVLTKDSPLLIERHRQVISNIYDQSYAFDLLRAECGDIGILASELGLIERNIGELIGVTAADDVLNHIFSNFCIGK
jgi:tRNA modification GTPase